MNSHRVLWMALLPALAHAHVLDRYPVVNLAGTGLPKLQNGGRVMDLFDGEHFDILLHDTPDPMRPPALIAFHGHESCPEEYAALNFEEVAETQLPARERLLVAKYNFDAAPTRAWYEWIPERDLKARFNVTGCPQIAFVPRHCNGWTQWCEREKTGDKTIMGCEDFVEQCTGVQHWDGTGDMVKWANDLIKNEGEVQISAEFGTYHKQGQWIQGRDSCATDELSRTHYMPPHVPAFSEDGYLALDTPPEIQAWLTEFYTTYKESGKVKVEPWDTTLTQNSFHETKMYQVDLDMEHKKKTEIGDRFLRPLLEEWSGVKDLEVTSIYGVREYYAGHWLGHHIDRETTHVLSATFSIAKLAHENMTQEEVDEESWPLEFINWKGQNVRYAHKPGTVVLYESVKGIHGRPYRQPHNGGIHVGAFFHYRPPKAWGDWITIAKQAHVSKERLLDRVAYKSRPSEEPVSPVFTSFRYGEGAIDHNAEREGMVDFTNTGASPLSLFWHNDEVTVAQCGHMLPGESCSFKSFTGHTFFFTEAIPGIVSFETTYHHNQPDNKPPAPLPGSRLTVSNGKKKYYFAPRHVEL